MTEAEQQGLADGRALRFLIPRRALRGGLAPVIAMAAVVLLLCAAGKDFNRFRR